MQALGRI